MRAGSGRRRRRGTCHSRFSALFGLVRLNPATGKAYDTDRAVARYFDRMHEFPADPTGTRAKGLTAEPAPRRIVPQTVIAKRPCNTIYKLPVAIGYRFIPRRQSPQKSRVSVSSWRRPRPGTIGRRQPAGSRPSLKRRARRIELTAVFRKLRDASVMDNRRRPSTVRRNS